MVTEPPVGTVSGAKYVVVAPLALDEELKEPQKPDGAQLQSTPVLAGALETVALRTAVEPVVIELGGAGLNAMEIAGGLPPLLPEVAWVEPPLPPPQLSRRIALKTNRGMNRHFIRSPSK